jgi:hypothetical protein
MTHLYSYSFGDCGPDYWRAWPILKITAKRIVIGGWHYGEHHLDRQKVEAGECYRPDKMYTEDQKRAIDPEGKLAVKPIPYDPATFAPKPDPEPTPEQLEFAKTLAKNWLRQHPDGKPIHCACHLALEHKLFGLHKHILAWKLHKQNKPVAVPDSFYTRLQRFVNDVQAVCDKLVSNISCPAPLVQYDDGPVWVRICLNRSDDDNSVYCFVRKRDGAIFVADGWKRPRTKTGIVGYLHDHAPDLLKGYGPSPQNGKRYLKGRQP